MLKTAKIVRGLLTRFLPACAAVTAAGIWYFTHGTGSDWFTPLVWNTARMSLSATLGAWLLLALFRSRMDPDTPVDARPSIIAGVLAPFVFFCVAVFASPMVLLGLGKYGVPGFAGALVTFGMFFPWLSHAKPRGRASARAAADDSRKLAEPFDVKVGTKAKTGADKQ